MHLPTEGFKYQLELIRKENRTKSIQKPEILGLNGETVERNCVTAVGRLVVCRLVKLADTFLTGAQTIVWRRSMQAQAEHLDLSQHVNMSHPSR